MIVLHAQGSLTLIGPRHYEGNVSITPSISSIQTVAIDTIVVAANQILKLENEFVSKKSTTPTTSTHFLGNSLSPLIEIKLAGITYGHVLSAPAGSHTRENTFPMWIGPGTHYIFISCPIGESGYRYSLHGLIFSLSP